VKSQHAPFDPDRGELEAFERNRRETTNHFSKEEKEEKKEKEEKVEEKEEKKEKEKETFRCHLHIIT